MTISDPEQALMLTHISAPHRPAVATLWALDARLGQVLATTSDPAIGAIRLAWWRDALERLDHVQAPAEPLLQRVSTTLHPQVAGAELAELATGWGAMIDGDPAGLVDYGSGRGGTLFGVAARLLDGDPARVAAAGAGWALVDYGWGQRDPVLRRAALEAARSALAPWDGTVPTTLRPLGMLGMLARRDVAAGPDGERRPGSPGRVARMLRYRLIGR